MSDSVYPIDLNPSRTRWCAYNVEDARAYAIALTTAGIDYTMHFALIALEAIQQWTFDRS